MNKQFIIGNLTADPELRTVPSGVKVCTFTVAVNRRFTDSNGERKADFYQVNAWRGLAETCNRYLAKGKKIAVIGEPSAHTYEAKDGTTKLSLEITADEIEFLSPRSADDNAGYQRQYPQQPSKAATQVDDGFEDVTDEDLPF